jgi:hypothetical protein
VNATSYSEPCAGPISLARCALVLPSGLFAFTSNLKHLTSNPPMDGFAVANIAASAALILPSSFNLFPLLTAKSFG